MVKSGSLFKNVNRQIKLFLLKLVIFIVSWEALYVFVLKPLRVPDKFLTTQLTKAVTFCLNLSASGVHTWKPEEGKASCLIQKEGRTVLVIFDDCNGFDLFIIYLAFIILLPYPLKRKLLFSFVGLLAIFVGNVVRCIGLYGLYAHYRAMFEFNHHYVFTIVMYLIIFYGWVLYTKKPLQYERS